MVFFGQALSSTAGIAGDLGGTKAQCFSYLAPCLIHFLTSATSYGVSRFSPDLGVGIISSESVEVTRRYNSDAPRSPGTSACAFGSSFNAAYALSGISRRKFAWRLLASGP